MQLVPTSGGREAFRKVKGQDTAPSRDYLFDPENNIELGVAYLNVLSYAQLEQIDNTISREYCVISAYNTGPRNVYKAFASDSVSALNAINGLEPPAVYDRLRGNLPYQETREYLVKVVTFRKQFIAPTAGTPLGPARHEPFSTERVLYWMVPRQTKDPESTDGHRKRACVYTRVKSAARR